jgi:hypothetical protein
MLLTHRRIGEVNLSLDTDAPCDHGAEGVGGIGSFLEVLNAALPKPSSLVHTPRHSRKDKQKHPCGYVLDQAKSECDDHHN